MKLNDRHKSVEMFHNNEIQLTCNTMFPLDLALEYKDKHNLKSQNLDIIGSLVFNESSNKVQDSGLKEGILNIVDRSQIVRALFNGVSIANDFFRHSHSIFSNNDMLHDYQNGLSLIRTHLKKLIKNDFH